MMTGPSVTAESSMLPIQGILVNQRKAEVLNTVNLTIKEYVTDVFVVDVQDKIGGYNGMKLINLYQSSRDQPSSPFLCTC